MGSLQTRLKPEFSVFSEESINTLIFVYNGDDTLYTVSVTASLRNRDIIFKDGLFSIAVHFFHIPLSEYSGLPCMESVNMRG